MKRASDTPNRDHRKAVIIRIRKPGYVQPPLVSLRDVFSQSNLVKKP